MVEDLQFLKTKANYIRHKMIEDMDTFLLAFETEFNNKNIKIRWIVDEDELVKEIKDNFSKSYNNHVCFDIPDVSEQFFENNNFIKKVSIEDLQKSSSHVEHLVLQADFGLVDGGALMFVNNKSLDFINNVDNLHIILNINDLIVKMNDIDYLLYLKYNCHQNINNYPKNIKFISSPFEKVISDNTFISSEHTINKKVIPTFLYLYDNGITHVLNDNVLRETLFCIKCAKCKEVCPVFKINQKYSPIDLIMKHCFNDNPKESEIFENTCLCGNCNDVCPVQIPFTDLLIYEMQLIRNDLHQEKTQSLAKLFSKRSKMNKLNNSFRRYFFINRYYSKNKKMFAYFKSIKLPFFNTTISNKPNNDK